MQGEARPMGVSSGPLHTSLTHSSRARLHTGHTHTHTHTPRPHPLQTSKFSGSPETPPHRQGGHTHADDLGEVPSPSPAPEPGFAQPGAPGAHRQEPVVIVPIITTLPGGPGYSALSLVGTVQEGPLYQVTEPSCPNVGSPLSADPGVPMGLSGR